jgi:hypothetical protein
MNTDLIPEKILVDYLHPFFEHNGFDYFPDLKEFRKKTNFGFFNFVFTISNYNNQYYAEFFIGFRIDIVEIPSQSLFGSGTRSGRDTNTLIVSTKKIDLRLNKNYSTTKHTSLENSCDYFIDFMDLVGFDFLDKYSKISNLHYLLNIDNCTSEKYYNNNFSRSFKGLAACAIAAPNHLKDVYDNQLSYLCKRNCPEPYIENFNKLYRLFKNTHFN